MRVRVAPSDAVAGGAAAAPQQASRGKPLRVHVATWNLGEATPPAQLGALLAEDADGAAGTSGTPRRRFQPRADVYALGVQEAPAPHGGQLETAVSGTLGKGYALLAARRLAGIACLVYVKRELYDDFVDVATDSVACGVAGVGFNKGGAAVSATHAPSGAALLFVSAHFAAHQDEVDKRNADFRKIDRGLFSGGGGSASSQGGSPTGGSSGGGGAGGDNRGGGGGSSRGRRSNYSASAAHDLAFWAGDFNYRIEGNRAAIDTALELGLYEVLAANDQLAAERKAGRVFGGFEEGKLAFMPTYKFDPGSDEYDTSAKARIPSWTDRVLWRLSANGAGGKLLVSQLSYHAVTAIKTSDHRAVAAAFEVRGRGSREQDGAAAGRGGQAATGGCGGGGACAVQ